jgi:hypothetical protein
MSFYVDELFLLDEEGREGSGKGGKGRKEVEGKGRKEVGEKEGTDLTSSKRRDIPGFALDAANPGRKRRTANKKHNARHFPPFKNGGRNARPPSSFHDGA